VFVKIVFVKIVSVKIVSVKILSVKVVPVWYNGAVRRYSGSRQARCVVRHYSWQQKLRTQEGSECLGTKGTWHNYCSLSEPVAERPHQLIHVCLSRSATLQLARFRQEQANSPCDCALDDHNLSEPGLSIVVPKSRVRIQVAGVR
jgi:hypothetical protein